MRIWLRAALLAIALLLVAVAGIEILRARLEQSAALRANLEAVAQGQLGISLRPGAIEVGFLPPCIRLRNARLELPGNAIVALGDVRIDLELGTLLEGDVRLQRLSISGPASILHRQLELSGELAVALEPGKPPDAWSLRADVRLATGGRVEASGGLDDSGGFAGTIALEGVEVEPFAVYLTSDRGEQPRLLGRYSGTFEVPAVGESLATLRLSSEQAEIVMGQASLFGPVALVAQLPTSASSAEPEARFAIDATQARVEFAGGPVRGSASGASLGGRIIRDVDGRLRLEEVGLKVTRFEGEAGRTRDDAG